MSNVLCDSLTIEVDAIINRGIKSVFIDDDGNLIFILTDGSVSNLGHVVGEDGTEITNIEATESSVSGGENIIKISLSDGRNYFFSVKNGAAGDPGESAYEIALKHGYSGTEEEYSQMVTNIPGYVRRAEQAVIDAEAATRRAEIFAKKSDDYSSASSRSAASAATSAAEAKEAIKSIDTKKDAAINAISEAEAASLRSINSVSDSAIAEISGKTEAGENAIIAKTEEQLARIPEVTELSTEVGNLKQDFNSLSDRVDNIGNVIEQAVEPLQRQADQTDRSLSALWAVNEGMTYRFETDTAEAPKTVPTGAKAASLLNFGGKSQVWTQLNDNGRETGETNGIKFDNLGDGSWAVTGTKLASGTTQKIVSTYFYVINGHKYVFDSYAKRASFLRYRLYINDSAIDTFDDIKRFFTCNESGRARIYIYCNSDVGYQYNNILKPRFFDLTAMFGSGNEPTSVDDPRIAWIEQYAEEHPEFDEGSIVSADVESVEVQGRNLATGNYEIGKWFDANGGIDNTAGRKANFDFIEVVGGCWYAVSAYSGGAIYTRNDYAVNIIQYDENKKFISSHSLINASKKLYMWQDAKFIRYSLISTSFDLMLVIGDALPTEFIPYTHDSYSIQNAVRALPGYGWSAGSVRNEVDIESKKYISRVGMIDAGDFDWIISGDVSNPVCYILADRNGIAYPNKDSIVSNLLSASYQTVAYAARDANIKQIFCGATKFLGIQNPEFVGKTAAERKVLLKGTFLLFEKLQPEITDISDLLTDDYSAMPVEAGGTITLTNGANLPVPNAVEYVVKLSEVGETA